MHVNDFDSLPSFPVNTILNLTEATLYLINFYFFIGDKLR